MSKIPIYIVGSWKHRTDVAHYIKRIHNVGFAETVHNWTKHIPPSINTEVFKETAIEDIEAVKKAEVVVAIMNQSKYPYRGTNCEIGAALGLGKPVLIFNPNHDVNNIHNSEFHESNVFYFHPLIKHFVNFDNLITELGSIRFKI